MGIRMVFRVAFISFRVKGCAYYNWEFWQIDFIVNIENLGVKA